MTHPFDTAIALEPIAQGRWRGHTAPDYWNIVGPYGGITAATLLQAVLGDPRRIGEPLALTTNYCAPIRAGAFSIEAEFVRTSRTTQHVSLRMVQPDANAATGAAVVVQAMAVMGVRRNLWGRLQALAPELPPAHTLERRPGFGSIRWLERFDSRHAQPLSSPPQRGQPTLNWVRDDPPRALDYPSLASLADSFLPLIFPLIGRAVPIASVSINIYFHAGAASLAAVGTDYLLGATETHVIESGFFDAESQLWHSNRLLATTQQVIWYRE